MLFDYMTLKLIWWFLICILFIAFVITGGMDLGVAILLPFLGKDDNERRLIINSIGPTWDGNQVWLLTAAGAIFAAWPLVYATAFSGLYFALLLVLAALILRPPGIDYRSKLPAKRWRNFWDWSLFISGALPAYLFGVAVGNLFLGIDFAFDDTMRVTSSGGLFTLLSPYTLLFGMLSLLVFIIQGGMFLQNKLPIEIIKRNTKIIKKAIIVFLSLFVLLSFWTVFYLKGFKVLMTPDLQSSFTPAAKIVKFAPGFWGNNYVEHKVFMLLPLLTIICFSSLLLLQQTKMYKLSMVVSSLGILNLLFTIAITLFPFILPSSLEPKHSLTIWDAVSSHKTLQLMFWAIVIFLPIVLLYTSWVYKVMGGRVNAKKDLSKSEAY